MSSFLKYRVHEVAKDFNVSSKVIIELLAKHFPGVKNHMTTLEEPELNLIFENFTQDNQVEGFEDYFARGEKQKEQERLKQKEQAAQREQERIEAARKAAAAQQAAQPAPQPQPQPQQAAQPQQPQQQRPFQQQPGAASGQGRPQQGYQQGYQGQQRGPGQGRPQQGYQQGYQGQQGQQRGPGQGRPQQGYQQGYQGQQGRPQGQPPRPPQGQQPQRPSQPSPSPAPRGPQQPQVQGARRDGVRIVDTRVSNVDLSKYDERVDALVPERVKNVGTQKQKIKKNPATRGPVGRQQGGYQSRRETEADRLKRLALEKARKAPITVSLPEEISVGDLAIKLKATSASVVKKLMQMGVMASVSQIIDFETAALVADELGAKVEKAVVVTIEDRLIDDSEDKAEDLVARNPVVVVMGHVDHGKTSLLDAIRNTEVAAGEAGGITQHIGAYQVQVGERTITFLDTPGHEAFTAMRLRGAQVTDIAILVVAADDGIMPQTVEAINHAKAAGVSIVVAINKIDKPGANPDRIKQELTEHGLLIEEWGGDTICAEVSALKRTGIEQLLETVLLVADMKELKANPSRSAKGTVIEAKLDKGRGPVATVLVQNGTLHHGDVLIAGSTVGRVRAMSDDRGRKIEEAGPSTPVEIIGLSEVPEAGDVFYCVADERMARELVDQRKTKAREAALGTGVKVSLDDLFSQISEGSIKELNIIIKADVQGSMEAVKASLEKLSNEEVRVRVIHGGVGAITESDVMLASASNAIIVGFNVRPDNQTRESASQQGVDIRTYRIIYECIEEMEAALKGMLAPKFKEVILGHAQVRQTFKVTGVGTIAGCYVLDGKITRNADVRLLRDSVVVAQTKIDSLKRFKDDAKEVATGFECGIGLEKFNDLKEGDVIEAYIVEEIKN